MTAACMQASCGDKRIHVCKKDNFPIFNITLICCHMTQRVQFSSRIAANHVGLLEMTAHSLLLKLLPEY